MSVTAVLEYDLSDHVTRPSDGRRNLEVNAWKGTLPNSNWREERYSPALVCPLPVLQHQPLHQTESVNASGTLRVAAADLAEQPTGVRLGPQVS